MNSHRHIKFVLSWERFLLAFVTGRPFPKMLVKMCAFERRRNVQKKHLCINRKWHRDRLFDQ